VADIEISWEVVQFLIRSIDWNLASKEEVIQRVLKVNPIFQHVKQESKRRKSKREYENRAEEIIE